MLRKPARAARGDRAGSARPTTFLGATRGPRLRGSRRATPVPGPRHRGGSTEFVLGGTGPCCRDLDPDGGRPSHRAVPPTRPTLEERELTAMEEEVGVLDDAGEPCRSRAPGRSSPSPARRPRSRPSPWAWTPTTRGGSTADSAPPTPNGSSPRLAGMTTAERAAMPVMAPGREDVIVAGAAILVEAMRRFGFDGPSCPRPTSSTGSCSEMLDDPGPNHRSFGNLPPCRRTPRNRHSRSSIGAARPRRLRPSAASMRTIAIALVIALLGSLGVFIAVGGDDAATGRRQAATEETTPRQPARRAPPASRSGPWTPSPARNRSPATASSRRARLRPKPQFSAPAQVIEEGQTYTAEIQTSCGTIVIELLVDLAPETGELVRLPRAGGVLRRPAHPPARYLDRRDPGRRPDRDRLGRPRVLDPRRAYRGRVLRPRDVRDGQRRPRTRAAASSSS